MANVQGFCTDEFHAVRQAFEKNLDSGADIGASAAVFLDGEAVVDLWGGFVDEAHTQPWQRDTIINTFSTTKTMTALCALVLADRGVIDLDAPVARYWPEFAAQGKGEIPVRSLLGHTSGLAGWTETVALEDMYDLDKSCDLLARQAPWWKPGTASGYHTYTIGHLVHGVIVRTTGLSLGQFFAREIAGPLGAEAYIGTGPEHDAKVVPLIPGTPPDGACGNRITDRSYFNPKATPYTSATIPWRRAEIGGSNLHSNARGVAAVQSVLANRGESHGVRILSAAGCERVLQRQASGTDLVLGAPLTWGLGYMVGCPFIDARLEGRAAGHRWAAWGGNGGSWVMVDLDLRMCVAFVMNQWIGGVDGPLLRHRQRGVRLGGGRALNLHTVTEEHDNPIANARESRRDS